MPDPTARNKPFPADDNDDIVDAEPDPITVEIAHSQQTADEEASFAKAEAGFSTQEHRHADQLRTEGRWLEAESYDGDARERMLDAQRVMQEANAAEQAANKFREEKKHRLALDLQQMSNQSLASLRTAVVDVRAFVQNLTPADKLKVGLRTGFDEQRIEELRERVIVTGYAIEQALTSEEDVRRDAQRIIIDLVTFTAAVMTIADHIPALMDLVRHFGQLLLQFHL